MMNGMHYPRNAGALAGLLFGLLLAGVDCAKDDNSTSPSKGTTNTSLSGSWKGTVIQTLGGGGTANYVVVATLIQKGDSLGGSWDWHWNETGYDTRLGLKGALKGVNAIAIVETSKTPLNWSGVGWDMTSYTGTVSSNRDTIYLGWTSPPPPGNFKLVRQ